MLVLHGMFNSNQFCSVEEKNQPHIHLDWNTEQSHALSVKKQNNSCD